MPRPRNSTRATRNTGGSSGSAEIGTAGFGVNEADREGVARQSETVTDRTSAPTEPRVTGGKSRAPEGSSDRTRRPSTIEEDGADWAEGDRRRPTMEQEDPLVAVTGLLQGMERRIAGAQEELRADLGTRFIGIDERFAAVEERMRSMTEDFRNYQARSNLFLESDRAGTPELVHTLNVTSAPVGLARAGIKINIPKFNGKTAWSEFDTQFKLISRINNWSEEVKAVALMNALEGSALSVLTALDLTDNLNFQRMYNLLEERFGSKQNSNLYFIQFQNYKQKFNQDFPTLAGEIEKLASIALSDCSLEARDRLAASQFINAIFDVEVQKQLRLAGPLSLNSAVVKAIEIQAVNKLANGRFENKNKNDKTENFNKFNNTRYRENNREREPYIKNSYKPPTINFNKEITCWNCGKIGHTRNNCRNVQNKYTKDRKE